MKKIIVFLIISFIFILPVKADLTKDQENDIAAFAANFITEGNKRLDKNGYPLLAYMQGQARIDGYQSKLYKVGYDYNHVNYVNANKWTFDCASFASYVYYHTFGLILTYNKTSQVDSYSGLQIRSATANPYQVSAFVDDANRGEHFYYIKKGVTGANMPLNELKKGDLIIYVGHHIMVYVGDGKIAEATTSCISKNNLGMQVIPLTSKYSNITLSVIRIKNKIISPSITANTKVKWLDTGETVELVSHTPKQEEYPTISYTKTSGEWAKSVNLEFELAATNGLKSYSFSENGDSWIDISGKSYTLKKTVTKNGTYILKVKDTKGLEKQDKVTISSIDDIKPIIKTLSVVQKENYSTIVVSAEDQESGLADKPYSFDGGLTWINNSSFDVNVEKEYTVNVKDKAGNIISMPISVKINSTTASKPSIANVINGEATDGTRKITVVVLDCSNCKIIIKDKSVTPTDTDDWTPLTTNSYITYLKPGTYNVWVKDNNGEILTKTFNVEIAKSEGTGPSLLIFIIPIFVIIVGIILIARRKTNDI